MELLIAIGRVHKEGPDVPGFAIGVMIDAVEQLNGHTVVEELASDLQVSSGRRLCISRQSGDWSPHDISLCRCISEGMQLRCQLGG